MNEQLLILKRATPHNGCYNEAVERLTVLLNSSKAVAMARIETLHIDDEECESHNCAGDDVGLAYPLVEYLLKPTVYQFLSMLKTTLLQDEETSSYSIASKKETQLLCKILQLFVQLMKLDVTLSEEIAKCGSHLVLSKVIYLDSTIIIESMYGSSKVIDNSHHAYVEEKKDEFVISRKEIIEQDEDILTEIQDQACGIVYDLRLPHLTFPVKVSPFSKDELIQRLPLVFQVQSPYCGDEQIDCNERIDDTCSISKSMSFLIQQITDRQSAQEDVGFGKFPSCTRICGCLLPNIDTLFNIILFVDIFFKVMWPSAVVLSSWLLSSPSILYNKRIVELGAGCGLRYVY